MPYPQYPTYGMPQQQPKRLTFVDGEDGMRSFYVAPGDVVALFDMGSPTLWLKSANAAGVPSFVAYDLVEQSESVHVNPADARIAELERQLAEIREVLSGDPIPDVRKQAEQPRHAGGGAGQAGGQQGWLAGGGGQAADGKQPAVQAGGGEPLA